MAAIGKLDGHLDFLYCTFHWGASVIYPVCVAWLEVILFNTYTAFDGKTGWQGVK